MQLTTKLLQVQRLEADHARLLAEHQLLMSCCTGLQQLRLKGTEVESSLGANDKEQALLQQLQVCWSR
jgi:hypothetical protein